MTEPSNGVRAIACGFVDDLRGFPTGTTMHVLAGDASKTMIQKAVRLLVDIGAPVSFDRRARVWLLLDLGWELPTEMMPREMLIELVDAARRGPS